MNRPPAVGRLAHHFASCLLVCILVWALLAGVVKLLHMRTRLAMKTEKVRQQKLTRIFLGNSDELNWDEGQSEQYDGL